MAIIDVVKYQANDKEFVYKFPVHRSVNGAGLFGIASRYVAVRSKALPCILKQNMESWSFPFINDEARRFAKHRIAQVIRYGERGPIHCGL